MPRSYREKPSSSCRGRSIPRDVLLQRLNRASGGVATVVAMRRALASLVRDRPELRAVDADFSHLLASWFNPGFLYLRQVDWNSPAALLEKIIRHEAVHAIRDWSDLRRLAARPALLRLLPSPAARRAFDLRRGGA